MSIIDKDKKDKLSAPSGKKFLLGVKDAGLPENKAILYALIMHRKLRRAK
jgi:hypothetical protein